MTQFLSTTFETVLQWGVDHVKNLKSIIFNIGINEPKWFAGCKSFYLMRYGRKKIIAKQKLWRKQTKSLKLRQELTCWLSAAARIKRREKTVNIVRLMTLSCSTQLGLCSFSLLLWSLGVCADGLFPTAKHELWEVTTVWLRPGAPVLYLLPQRRRALTTRLGDRSSHWSLTSSRLMVRWFLTIRQNHHQYFFLNVALS